MRDEGAARARAHEEELLRAIRRISGRVLGTVLGLVLGFGVFLLTAILLLKGGETVGPHLALLGQLWPGYSVTWGGSLVGFVYGFLTGFFSGWLIGRIYNALLHRRAAKQPAAPGPPPRETEPMGGVNAP